MKKIYYLALLLFVSIAAFSQSQNYMSYQAVIRNSSNNLITNQAVGMRISILQGSVVGTEAYVETQTPISNINGLVTLEIGNGTPIIGTYNAINWATGPYFIKTETDPTGGNSYTIVGVSQLMSVPYALYALNSGSSIPGPAGPQGPAGNDGLDGATGPMGPQGPAGINGLEGATGPMGPQGPAGLNGVDGATGPMGPQGPAGNDGLDGATGPMGPQGPQGPQGLQGPAGSPATMAFSFMSKTADYTITSGDATNNLIVKNSSNSVVTFTLPSASAVGIGKMIYITSTSTSSPQSINVLTNGSDLFFGFYTTPSGTTDISATTLSNISWVQLISDGTSWNILGMYW